tara:strand:- start:722 stop:1183 length:462 start_codon:yes stop_codon:yes gene_type:complete
MSHQLEQLLTYLGIIPFLFLAVMINSGTHSLPYVGSTLDAFCLYGLIIAVFLLGSLWSIKWHLGKWKSIFVALMSNFGVLVLYFSYLLMSRIVFMLTNSLVFALILAIDYWLLTQRQIAKYYFGIRFNVSLIVIVIQLSVVFFGFNASLIEGY